MTGPKATKKTGKCAASVPTVMATPATIQTMPVMISCMATARTVAADEGAGFTGGGVGEAVAEAGSAAVAEVSGRAQDPVAFGLLSVMVMDSSCSSGVFRATPSSWGDAYDSHFAIDPRSIAGARRRPRA